jgi:hypothetical protein
MLSDTCTGMHTCPGVRCQGVQVGAQSKRGPVEYSVCNRRHRHRTWFLKCVSIELLSNS